MICFIDTKAQDNKNHFNVETILVEFQNPRKEVQ